MRLGHLTAALVLLAAGGPLVEAAPVPNEPAAGAGGPIATATRQTAFTIPFRIEPAQTPSAQPVEVQLHVSTDQGATWSLATSVPPARGSFVFRAPHDGEYWYSIRTLDAQGVVRPEGTLSPQLKVTVDTVAPRLDLSVARGAAGEIVARWQAVDPNLKRDSFKFEYQSTATGPWERVAVESPPGAMRHTLSGEATWWPNASDGPILVRAEVIDASGNPAVTQAVVKKGDAATPGSPLTVPVANAEGWRANDAPRAPAGDTRWPPDRAMPNSLASSPDRPPPTPDTGAGAGLNSASGPAGFAPDTNLRTPAQSVSDQRPARPGSPLDFSLLPAAVRPRMVNSASFELEYEIESVGPSGVGRVELWGTRDGGRTWSDFAVDADRTSPMSVNVGGEGIYGFCILVQSGSGFGGRPPAEGDMPDIWIGVDLTRPTCKITGAETSADGAELVIRWEAADDALDPRGVTLLFSASLNGPWTPIVAGVENTGSYAWRLDGRVPERVLLRLEVRDEAGNVASFDTPNPVGLDRYRPSGRIRGVRPLVGQGLPK
jgi:hypothetical protein